MYKPTGFIALPMLGLLVVVAAGIAFASWWIAGREEAVAPTISNFAECAAAGNAIMESYPRQCAANGQTFVEVIANANTTVNENVNGVVNSNTNAGTNVNAAVNGNTNTAADLTAGYKTLNEDRLVRIKYPPQYTLKKNEEKNRRGSFSAYNIAGNISTPTMQELQLFSRESIEAFNQQCQNTPCFAGDYPTVGRFDGLRQAYEDSSNYQQYVFMTLGGEKYLVKNIPATGDEGLLREYDAFVGTTMVTLWVYMQDSSQNSVADSLVTPWVLEYSGF